MLRAGRVPNEMLNNAIRYPVLAKLNQPCFPRFRLTWLRKNGVPKDLERFRMGHEDEGDRGPLLKAETGRGIPAGS
jgi:hypothetical protein